MPGSGIGVPMQAIEVHQLADLVGQFVSLLRDSESVVQAGQDGHLLARLTPAVYPQDPEASAEFAAATRDDLLDRRAAEARIVRDDLESVLDGDVAVSGQLTIPAAHVDSWLRTLAALRLVIATRLGIEDEPTPDPDDPRLGVYEWLGYRLELLVEAADAEDDAAPSAG
ncbi:DUF2017 family protein [Microbacterium sp. USTB-Y]|uniref:DUF2017 family protein n=1 Tax=Microbacterium sp. USTB-Y TaxID=2823692 RepID=UPI00203D0E45|nr:DUF2017 family protein [Microbacterium sp. USTB-Y]